MEIHLNLFDNFDNHEIYTMKVSLDNGFSGQSCQYFSKRGLKIRMLIDRLFLGIYE